MISKLQSIIIKRKIGASMVFLALSIFGVLALKEIPISLLPSIELPKITIITHYPNSAPEEMENLITKPITEAVGTVQGIDRVESESREGYSFVNLQFKNGTNVNYAMMEVREKLDLIRDFLPQGASKPILTRFDPTKTPFVEIVFFSKGLSDEKKLRSFIEDNIKVFLDRVDGVAVVQLAGGYEREVMVSIDPERMNSFKVTPIELRTLFTTTNRNFPAGQLPVGDKDLLIRAMGEFRNVDDIKNLIVQFSPESAPVFLSDFSDVTEVYKERSGLARYNNQECVIAYLYKEPGKNSVEVASLVRDVVSQLKENFNKEISTEIVFDESIFIKESIKNLFQNLVYGSILAFLALLIVLRNFRSPILLLIVIPVTLLPSFLVFKYLGISFNLMSLGGLALGIGMLFDSSNVVLSAIERNILEMLRDIDLKNSNERVNFNQKLETAILNGSGEVISSVFSATATTIIVFLPITFLKSILGLVFAEMALAIVITLAFSLLNSITFIPLLSSIIYSGRNFKPNTIQKFLNQIETNLFNKYLNTLKIILKTPKIILFLTVCVLITSVTLIPYIPKEYLPRVDTSEFQVIVSSPKGTSLNSMTEIIDYLEKELKADSNVKSIITNIGGDEESLRINPKAIYSSDKALIRVLLNEDRKISTSEFISKWKNKLNLDSSTILEFNLGGDILGSLLGQNKGQVELLIIGEDLDNLTEIGQKIKDSIVKFENVLDVRVGMEDKNSEVKLKFDQVKLSKYGLNHSSVAILIKTALKGMTISQLKVGDSELNIKLKFKKEFVDSLEKIQRLKMKTIFNEDVFLNQFLSIHEEKNLSSILRRGNFRVNSISVSLSEKELEQTLKKIESSIAETKLPDGFKILFSGDKENLEKSSNELFYSFLLAALLIYMLLSAQFESLKTSMIMISTIPLIFIGTFPALLVSNKSLNVSSFMGFILLIGVVVDNASLFSEYLHLYESAGLEKLEAILETSRTILKPVIMNNSTTILGMLPVVYGSGKGGEFQVPLGIVVISGLFSATILTLFIIPILSFLRNDSKVSLVSKL